MSNRPPKRSDINKPWMKPRRDRKTSIKPEYHLIVAEGEKTEPNYFSALKNDLGANGDRINIEIPNRTGSRDPMALVNIAQKYVCQYSNRGIYIKHVWVLYDKDENSDEVFNGAADECMKLSTDDIKYHALWSNESFEYWFVLHYEYLNTDTAREDYYPKLSRYMHKEYDKADPNIYHILKPMYETAIKNAKRMMEVHGDKPPSDCRPGTRVYEILEYLKAYIKD